LCLRHLPVGHHRGSGLFSAFNTKAFLARILQHPVVIGERNQGGLDDLNLSDGLASASGPPTRFRSIQSLSQV